LENERVDTFLRLAQSIDKFKDCHTVYDLFEIKDRNAPYPDTEKQIESFVKFYAGNNAPKFKQLGRVISGEAETVKRVLRDHRRAYNEYLQGHDPGIQKLREHFAFCTKRDKKLDSKEKAELIEEAKEVGLSDAAALTLINKWLIEFGVEESEDRADSSATSSTTGFTDVFRKTYYEILGVPNDADYSEIKKAYEKEWQKTNSISDKRKVDARRYELQKAWECLKDPVEKGKYDKILKDPQTPVPRGKPRLVVECKGDYTFKDVRRGTTISETITIKNPEGGLLQGTIKTDSAWLEPGRNRILEKNEQELEIGILTGKIPPKMYKTEGHITIDTNGGPPYTIPFKVFLQNYEIELQRFRKTWIPVCAAVAGLTGSFASQNHFSGFLIGMFIFGFFGYLLSKEGLELFIKKGIGISKYAPVALQGISVGLVVLAIVAHSGGNPEKSLKYTSKGTETKLGDKAVNLSPNTNQKESHGKLEASLPYTSLGKGKILGDRGVDFYQSIIAEETRIGDTVFPVGYPSGKVISQLASGEIVEIVRLISCDCEASMTLKVKRQTGDVGYIQRGMLQLVETYNTNGAMASIYFSIPYEYECHVASVDRDISKFRTFMNKYPSSIFVPAALEHIGRLQSYMLQCGMTGLDRHGRFNGMKSAYERLFKDYDNSRWAKIAKDIYEFVARNEGELCKLQVNRETFDRISELQRQLSSVIPSFYDLQNEEDKTPIREELPYQRKTDLSVSTKHGNLDAEGKTAAKGSGIYKYEDERGFVHFTNNRDITGSPVKSTEASVTEGKNASTVITTAEVEMFLEKHLRATEKAESDIVLSHYADKVDYYSAGVVGKDYIKKDKEYFYKRWPKMKYTIVSEVKTVETAFEDEKIAQFTYDFFVQSGKRYAKGTARNSLRVKKIADTLRIVEEKQEVIKREGG
jgi:DnaJ-domain-containing protein 1